MGPALVDKPDLLGDSPVARHDERPADLRSGVHFLLEIIRFIFPVALANTDAAFLCRIQ